MPTYGKGLCTNFTWFTVSFRYLCCGHYGRLCNPAVSLLALSLLMDHLDRAVTLEATAAIEKIKNAK